MTRDNQSVLTEILKSMDIPAMRMDVTRSANLRWLSRNMMARNSEHPRLLQAKTLLRRLLVEAK